MTEFSIRKKDRISYDIWEPNRATLDDEAVGGNNRNDRGKPMFLDEADQTFYDELHLWEKKWQAKYPKTGIPPNDSPDWDEFWETRPKTKAPTGKKLALKAAIE